MKKQKAMPKKKADAADAMHSATHSFMWLGYMCRPSGQDAASGAGWATSRGQGVQLLFPSKCYLKYRVVAGVHVTEAEDEAA